MALNENIKNLIRSVVNNDLSKAKSYVKVILKNENAASNKSFCDYMRKELETQPNFIELPYDIRGILKMEDVSTSFNENRYFITYREKRIFKQIDMTNNTNKKLKQLGIRYLNTTLLYGETGTGKTTFGKYVAYKLGLPFAYLNFSQCITSLLGGTSKNIDKVFEYVSKQKCVLMLDEIDAIGIKRGIEDLGEMSRVVISLMQSFDLLDNEIIVIGATNRKDMIDEALIRRFSIIHEVKTLNPEEVQTLITNYMKDVNIEFDEINIKEYSIYHNKQSEIVKDIVKGIVKMLNDKTKFMI
jgi:SpoVK/Ycf46/Vps4 family AAA+-type ATPase